MLRFGRCLLAPEEHFERSQIIPLDPRNEGMLESRYRTVEMPGQRHSNDIVSPEVLIPVCG